MPENASVRLALYQPDIPQNTGTMLRLAACLNVTVDLIGPAGFDTSDAAFRRAGLDYLAAVHLKRHVGWRDFLAWRREQAGARLILLTTSAVAAYTDIAYNANDILMVGRESAGVPDDVHAAADLRVRIPMAAGQRSLNVAVAAAMVLGEAVRQTDLFPLSTA